MKPAIRLPIQVSTMERYDPLRTPDPQAWLALDENERIALAKEFHRRARVELPNHDLHATVHAVIETQAALGDETPVRRTIERLISEGLDRHEAIHAIAQPFSEMVYDIARGEVREGTDPNKDYFAAVESITAEGWRRSGDPEMDITEIIEALAGSVDEIPAEAIRAARAQRTDVIPHFIAAFERFIEGKSEADETPALFWMFHLLGEWGEKSAYPILAKFLRRPADELEPLLGDAIPETSHRVMAAVFDGDPNPLYDIILDEQADEFVRAQMCRALAIIVLGDKLARRDVAPFLQTCSSAMQPQRRSDVWAGWADAVAILGLSELKPLVERVFARGLIDPFIMRFEHFDEDLKKAVEHPEGPQIADDPEWNPFRNTIEELSDWGWFAPKIDSEEIDESGGEDEDFLERRGAEKSLLDRETWPNVPVRNPLKGIGRNDPCPCGSGKKFKRCCLNKEAA